MNTLQKRDMIRKGKQSMTTDLKSKYVNNQRTIDWNRKILADAEYLVSPICQKVLTL